MQATLLICKEIFENRSRNDQIIKQLIFARLLTIKIWKRAQHVLHRNVSMYVSIYICMYICVCTITSPASEWFSNVCFVLIKFPRQYLYSLSFIHLFILLYLSFVWFLHESTSPIQCHRTFNFCWLDLRCHIGKTLSLRNRNWNSLWLKSRFFLLSLAFARWNIYDLYELTVIVIRIGGVGTTGIYLFCFYLFPQKNQNTQNPQSNFHHKVFFLFLT